MLALRDGELSLLYPVIALTYVWVTVLSLVIFHEAMNPFKTQRNFHHRGGGGGAGQGRQGLTATPVSSMLMVLLASFIGSFGAVFLKAGSEKLKAGWHHALNPKLMLGVGLFVASSFFFLQGIRHGELSVLYPMVSLGYIWTLVWSRIFFSEPFTRLKFVGLFLIVVGVCFVGMGSK